MRQIVVLILEKKNRDMQSDRDEGWIKFKEV